MEWHPKCTWDSLRIFDGMTSSAEVIGQFCGTTTPNSLLTGGARTLWEFVSDHVVSRKGFLAKIYCTLSTTGELLYGTAHDWRYFPGLY